MTRCSLFIAALAALVAPAFAQTPTPRPPADGCAAAAPSAAATPPARGADSGTAPGGMGSTAWSGGTGGSYVGTVPAGPQGGSPSPHPPVATGLDPTTTADDPVRRAC